MMCIHAFSEWNLPASSLSCSSSNIFASTSFTGVSSHSPFQSPNFRSFSFRSSSFFLYSSRIGLYQGYVAVCIVVYYIWIEGLVLLLTRHLKSSRSTVSFEFSTIFYGVNNSLGIWTITKFRQDQFGNLAFTCKGVMSSALSGTHPVWGLASKRILKVSGLTAGQSHKMCMGIWPSLSNTFTASGYNSYKSSQTWRWEWWVRLKYGRVGWLLYQKALQQLATAIQIIAEKMKWQPASCLVFCPNLKKSFLGKQKWHDAFYTDVWFSAGLVKWCLPCCVEFQPRHPRRRGQIVRQESHTKGMLHKYHRMRHVGTTMATAVQTITLMKRIGA